MWLVQIIGKIIQKAKIKSTIENFNKQDLFVF